MSKLKLYLSSPFYDWGNELLTELRNLFEVHNPIENSRQGSQSEYTSDDINACTKSDIILAFQPDREPCLSVAVEATIGYCNGATVIYVDERGKIDPFMVAISKRAFSKLSEAINFLRKLSVDPQKSGVFVKSGNNLE